MSPLSGQVPIHDIETKKLQNTGFNIIDLSITGSKSYDTNVLHRHTFFELFLFNEASGNHEIDFNVYKVEDGCVHFVSPGQIHKLVLKKNKGFVICFTEEFPALKPGEDLVQSFPFFDDPNQPLAKLKKQEHKEIAELVAKIFQEYKEFSHDRSDLLSHYLIILLIKLRSYLNSATILRHGALSEKNPKVSLFKRLVNSCYLEHKPVSFYATELNITPNHLNALCKKFEGRSAIRLIQQRLALEAKRMLYATDLSVKEISYRLGFDDTGYFNRFFKAQVHLTPVQYRERFSKNR
jgi:AraC-like DNA-binding protein